ncbi:MAG: glutamate--tRNA ligase [Saprospiraceae bacterium]|nr:glutamate--tRNA ligase [Saprospiraceae bacterium]
MTNVRVRFAPSPTGPLHIGGVRTALYNYLFAKKHGGTFILRIEDTDQKRYVPGAEEYIVKSLEWFGLTSDESPLAGGDYGPYRQSERKSMYKKYAEELIEKGFAYYCFDTSDELDTWRKENEASGNQGVKYNYLTRGEMKNSLSLSPEESRKLLDKGENVTIRLKIEPNRSITINDEVRGDVTFNSSDLDEKVIFKADGMPTYHLANIVDDHKMEISHVIRGEEWLSSTPHHLLMYEYFGWTPPSFSHLSLIIKPVGKGKLGKRDGAKFGFPVFPFDWFDTKTNETFIGFQETGYLPEAVINFVSLLGWNPGNDEEIFTMEELIKLFSLDRIVKAGARFDVDKSKWFNQQYIIAKANTELADLLKPMLVERNIDVTEDYLLKFVDLMKERVEMLPDFFTGGAFFFSMPEEIEEKMARKKYKLENRPHFDAMIEMMRNMQQFTSSAIETTIKSYISENELGFGAILPILRLGTCGTMKGPDLFETMELLGQQEVIDRLSSSLEVFTEIKNRQNA